MIVKTYRSQLIHFAPFIVICDLTTNDLKLRLRLIRAMTTLIEQLITKMGLREEPNVME